MSSDIFDPLQRQLLDEIAAEALLVSQQTGRPEFSACVLGVIKRVPRHEFVPVELKFHAYVNSPLPIGYDKTISQPFIVALMTDLLDIDPQHVVLEIGTGAGYQAAVLAELAKHVYTLDIVEELAASARRRLDRLGYKNVTVGQGNGYYGWPEHAPYDGIIVTTAPDLIPPPLLAQLKPGGKMIIPAGIADHQQLMLVEKQSDGSFSTRNVLPVRFSELESGEDVRGTA
ncbi:MAG TPA: protein-L-isoaspartate(D-aspartate) O-methyltransferase [Burkholderiales bacterium]|jgi:protein-L-isoaspartate(D-aspartate) O-methyltransferase|nr:protein-L-isoaspartate(D-aspartate) O-methyltransferase [Burkholderiales bacterium]